MRKIINTFKHGSSDVKRILLLTILSGAAAVIDFVVALLESEMVFFFGGVAMVFVSVALAQTLGIREDLHEEFDAEQVNRSKKRTSATREADEGLNQSKPADFDDTEYDDISDMEFDAAQTSPGELGDDMEELTESISENTRTKSKKKKTKKRKIKKAKADTTKAKEKSEKQPKQKKDKRTKLRKSRKNKADEAGKEVINELHISMTPEKMSGQDFEADENVHLKYMDDEAAVYGNGEDDENTEALEQDEILENENTEIKRINEETVKAYDKKKVKKTLHKYKVKRDHRMVMVDRCEKLNIHETPAYIWVDNSTFHLLLIEHEPRLISFPLYSLNQITYFKKVPSNEYTEYSLFKNAGGLLVDLFKPYLPEYTSSTVLNDMTSYKNLYGIGPGIYFTNTSAKSLFDLLAAEFVVRDKVTESDKVNVYFKEAYKANIKLRDNVIDANGYADSISGILDNLARSTISYNEFKETLNLMVRNKLITQEFAVYYMEVRDKLTR